MAGGRGVVYGRHPRCPRVSLLLSPCILVKTLQGGREGFITCFTNMATECGGAACYSPRVVPLPLQEPQGPATRPPIPLGVLNPAVPWERDGMGQVRDPRGSRQGSPHTHTHRHTRTPSHPEGYLSPPGCPHPLGDLCKQIPLDSVYLEDIN